MTLDSQDRLWIHDGATNQIIGFESNFKERTIIKGVSFNSKLFNSD